MHRPGLQQRQVFSVAICLFFPLIGFAPGLADADGGHRIPCPYQTAHDAPLDVVADAVERADHHTQLRVEFNGVKGDRVPSFLYVPNDDRSKHPAVLLQYGSGGDKKVDYIVALAHQFVARGFIVLTIDSPGRGERKSANAPKRGLADWL